MTSSPTFALREDYEEVEEVTAERLPEPALIARSRMKSVTIPPPAFERTLHAVEQQGPASSIPAPRFSMRVPVGTHVYSQVVARQQYAPAPASLAPAYLPGERSDLGLLEVSALRLLLARLTEDAGPAARPMMLVEIQQLGATVEVFPRLLIGTLITRLSERLDVVETRRNFILDARELLDRELYVQLARR